MRHTVVCVSAALVTFSIATISAAVDDREICSRWRGEEAIAVCGRLISRNPTDAAAYENRGNAYLERKLDYDQAIADYDQAIRLDPNMATAYYNRGKAYENKRDYARAIADYDQSLKLDPNEPRARASVIRLRAFSEWSSPDRETCRKGLGDEAVAACSRLVGSNPARAVYFNQRGNAYAFKHDYDRAISDYDQALRLRPNLAGAYNNRGNAYNHKGDHDQAISDASEAIRLDAKDAGAYTTRAEAYEAKNDLDHAIADFDRALKLDPKNATAREGRERVQTLLTTNRPGPAPSQAQLPPQTSPPQR